MATEQGTFPMKNPGVDNDPDFHSGPDALPQTERGLVRRVVSQSAPNTTVEFIREVLTDRHKEKVARYLNNNPNGKALFGDAEWNSLNGAGKADAARDWMQKLVKYLRLA